MHIVLVGPGALGSLFAIRLNPHLQEEGNALFLLDHNPQRARQLAESGLTLQHGSNIFTAAPPITPDPATLTACDILLLCVKAGAVEKSLNDAASLIQSDTLVIGMQNGMAHLKALQKTAGIAIAATSSEGATLKAPGLVTYGGAGLTRFGLLKKDTPLPKKLTALANLFTQADLQAEVVQDIQPYLWAKLFINVGINALTAIYGQKNGWLLTDKRMMAIMRDAIAEAITVAEKKNITATGEPLNQAYAVCRKTANNVSSMLQDIRKKRRTEIDAINGYIVHEGKKLGIPTPVNAELVRQIKKIERTW